MGMCNRAKGSLNPVKTSSAKQAKNPAHFADDNQNADQKTTGFNDCGWARQKSGFFTASLGVTL